MSSSSRSKHVAGAVQCASLRCGCDGAAAVGATPLPPPNAMRSRRCVPTRPDKTRQRLLSHRSHSQQLISSTRTLPSLALSALCSPPPVRSDASASPSSQRSVAHRIASPLSDGRHGRTAAGGSAWRALPIVHEPVPRAAAAPERRGRPAAAAAALHAHALLGLRAKSHSHRHAVRRTHSMRAQPLLPPLGCVMTVGSEPDHCLSCAPPLNPSPHWLFIFPPQLPSVSVTVCSQYGCRCTPP